MSWVALKMLIGNRGKYFAIVFGIAFACMLMAQQASIFVGLMRNTTSQIRDISGADIWVMDPSVEFVDDITPLSDDDLYRVRGVSGVAWAVPLYKGLARAQFHEGNFKQFIVMGLDDQIARRRPAANVARLGRPICAARCRHHRRIWFPLSLAQSAATNRRNVRDERQSGSRRRHLPGLAQFSNFSDRLCHVQPGTEVRGAGAARVVVRFGKGGAGRAGR